MTSEPAAARFDHSSLIVIGISIGAAVVCGLVCAQLKLLPGVTGTLVSGAGALPAAIEYRLLGRRRNVTDEISRIRQGELRRPVGLVVVMLAAALFLAEVMADAAVGARALATSLPGVTLVALTGLIAAALAFFISWYASHYLGKHPYRWTVVAVGGVFIIIVAANLGSFGAGWRFVLYLSSVTFAHSSLVLNASLAGVWCGRGRHDKFLAKKLARLERKALRKKAAKRPESTPQSQATGMQASAQDSSAPQDLVPIAVNVATQPNGAPPSLPHNLPTRDPFEQIEKLAHLRDTGALTEEEFQAKKTQVLGRI
jgi:Short C-terminal domain